MNPTTFDKAREQSVRKFPNANENPLSIALYDLRGPALSPWGTRRSEWELRRWYRHESNWMVQGTIMGIVTKFLASPWEVTGPKTGINYAPYFQDILREMPPGDGWDSEWSKTWLDYFRQDGGGYLEVIGPGDETSALTGRITGLANLDSLRCYPTADPDYPVIYWDRDGGRHKMHRTRILHFVDMPDGDDFNPGYGMCALRRAISIVQQQYLMLRYAAANLDDLPPPGFASLLNMTEDKFLKAVESFTQRKSNDLPPAYGNLVLLSGLDADHAPKIEITSFSQAPESFSFIEWTDLQVNALALVFGIDKQEIWELASKGIGTATQSETLHAKSETKTIGHMRSLAERRLNSTLPRSCEFKFKVKDGQQAQADAANAQTWAGAITSMGVLIQPNEARLILSNMVEAVHDAITDEQGQLIRLNDADIEDEEAQVSVGDAATTDTPKQPAPAEPAAAASKDIQSTRLDFEADFADLLTGARDGSINRRRFGVVLRALVGKYGKSAYKDGLIDGGISDGVMDEEDNAAYAVELAKQSAFVTALGDAVYQQGISDAQAAGKAQMWFNGSIAPFFDDGRGSADRNGYYTFHLGGAENHCLDCLRLDGQTHRFKDYQRKNLIPGRPGQATECGGWQCKCSITKADSGMTASGSW